MTSPQAVDSSYAGFLPPPFKGITNEDDLVIRTWFVGDALSDRTVPPRPDALAIFMDLVAPSAQRAGSNGFALLWLDCHPHEDPGWRLSIGHCGEADDIELIVARPLARLVDAMKLTEFETVDWSATRALWRKRAQPVQLVFWGNFSAHIRQFLGHSDIRSFYLPMGAGLRSDQVQTLLPLLDDMLSGEMSSSVMGFEDALHIGVALGRSHIIESWIEAGGTEKEPFFRPMRIWHQAWLSRAMIDPALASLAMAGQPPIPALCFDDDASCDQRRDALDALSSWLGSVFFHEGQPALRNAFVAGVSHAVWFDPDLQQYMQPQQRAEILQSLLPYARWFLAMALYNHLGNLAEGKVTVQQASLYALLLDALPELASLDDLATRKDIERHIIRIDAARAASAFDSLIIPFCDMLLPGFPLAASRG